MTLVYQTAYIVLIRKRYPKGMPCHNIELAKDHFKQLANSGLNVPVVKIMGLSLKPKLYYNPYITAADIVKNKMKMD